MGVLAPDERDAERRSLIQKGGSHCSTWIRPPTTGSCSRKADLGLLWRREPPVVRVLDQGPCPESAAPGGSMVPLIPSVVKGLSAFDGNAA